LLYVITRQYPAGFENFTKLVWTIVFLGGLSSVAPCDSWEGKMKKYILALLVAFFVICSVSPAEARQGETPTTEILVNEQSISVVELGNTLSTLEPSSSDSVTFATKSSYQLATGAVSADSLQIVITILDSTAPNRFAFKMSGASEIQMFSVDDRKLYKLIGSEGETLAWIAEPWARDAVGTQIPTHFEIERGNLVQVVDIPKDLEVAYPVTADPYLGKDLISSVSYSYDSKKNSINLKIYVSAWLGQQYVDYLPWAYTPGVAIAQILGWTEVLNKYTANYGVSMTNYIKSHETYEDQYDCHALGAPAIFVNTFLGKDKSPSWDLEGYRRSAFDVITWVNSGCNW
jgi:hypothetical protein